ncbi:SIR2 family protein [Acinetobacter nosocomialis]|uniref:SIR2 family protein n=1 Tax=Acinetobacter nosocomialis TaxID=106654 RepID=UPI003005E1D1
MRFTKTGPNIPDELIEAQKKGELLFFCGAGVSVPAGLPNFYSLTKNVAEKLHALDDENNEISQLLKDNQFDRTFSVLKRIYGDESVDSILLDELKLTKTPLLSNHENLLKLSRNEEKKPFLITTNFDLLFEKVDNKIKSFVPPYLPDLQSKAALSGIVYLHGKWIDPKKNETNNLIISSQDFGSAYLSHGWATRFLSNLLTRRTVVLIGYSGDDTLVRYLLEGLNTEKTSKLNKIYAFERGPRELIEQKWAQLGAIGLSYPEHNDLWQTITEWAKYAGDEDKWNKHLFDLSQKSPKDLQPFERGQIASFISSKEGAYKFLGFTPPPNSEWIYVFDKYIRLGPVEIIKNEEGEKFEIDPIDLYGIDSDPKRIELDSLQEPLKSKLGYNFIESLPDETTNLKEKLSNLSYEKLWFVESRIVALARWFANVAEQPAAIWWAQKQANLHPIIIDRIKRKILEQPQGFVERDLIFWTNFINSYQERSKIASSNDWYEVKRNLEHYSKDTYQLNFHYLNDLLSPILILEPKYSTENIYLPTQLHENYLTTKFTIDFPYYHLGSIEIKDEYIVDTIKVLTQVFIKYIYQLNRLEDESIKHLFHTFYFPSINFKNPLQPYRRVNNKIGNLIIWMCSLLKRLSSSEENTILEAIKNWPENDELIFNRLKLFLWSNLDNINNFNIEKYFLQLSDNFFWNRYIELDIINLISTQWDNLPEKIRVKFERKIIKYRKIYNHENYDQYIDYRNYQVGRFLNTINQTSIGLTERSLQEFDRIKKTASWKDSYLEQESLITGVKSSFVSTNTSFEELTNIENSSVFFEKISCLEKDRSAIFQQRKPFIGFLSSHPDEALDKLAQELSKNNFQAQYWRQFFENLPANLTIDQIHKIGNAILILPEEIIYECRFVIPTLLNEKFSEAYKNSIEAYLDIWDNCFNKLNSIGEKATKSLYAETFINNKIIKTSRKTLDNAFNSPIGQLVNAIFHSNDIWNLKPIDFKKIYLIRLEKCLNCVGEGAYHTITILSLYFSFMCQYFPQWSDKFLVPFFDVKNTNSEAAWNGFLYSDYNLTDKSIMKIKPYIIDLFNYNTEWLNSERFKANFPSFLIFICFFSYPKGVLFSNLEIRILFRQFDHDMLSRALWTLNQIFENNNNWKTFGRYFFKNMWPKENYYQSSKTSERLISLAFETSNNFIDIVKHIYPFLRPVDPHSLFLYRITKGEERSYLVKDHPDTLLKVLNKVIGPQIEYYDDYLKQILEEIAVHKPSLKQSLTWQHLYAISNHSFS